MSAENVIIVTPAELEQITKLYERSDTEIAEDVKLIQAWFHKQPHLPQNEDCEPEDEDIIRRSLQFNKFSVERTKQKLDYLCAARNFAPEYLHNFHPLHPSMQTVHSYGCFVPLPKLTPDFGRISVAKFFSMDCPEFTSAGYMKAILCQSEIRCKFDNHMHDIIIFDMLNMSFANSLSIRPVDVIKGYALLEKAYSERIKEIHFLNSPTYVMGFITLIKSVLSQKMGNRIQIHPNIESLYKVVPKELLPKDYGGNELTLIELHKNWVKFMESKNDWMLERGEMKSNEKRRIGTPLDIEVFGTEGTFRKLNID